MVGLWYYNQNQLLIMRDPHYVRMCFKSVKTLRGTKFLAVEKASALKIEIIGFVKNGI